MVQGFRYLEIALLLIGGYAILPANALVCYHCDNVPSPSHCNTTSNCSTGENCFTEEFTNNTGDQATFKLGCRSAQECSKINQQSVPSFVGKRNSQPSESCIQCCGVDSCNAHVCALSSTATIRACADDETFDCAAFSERFPICSDVHNAMKTCKKFCGLCEIDGHWSEWMTWSVCGRSCGQGQRSRSRACINPAPANGGADCQGDVMETETCNTGQHCPVHGQWTHWSPWGICSVTCGIGLERRDRICSNPYPAYGGDYCPGDTRDDRTCVVKACADGGWSYWSGWGACSKTCGTGLAHRHRQCNNPTPSPLGKQCDGDPAESKLCVLKSCDVHGQWTHWSPWGICSVTCGIGLERRDRICSNPYPAYGGDYCPGDTRDDRTCVVKACADGSWSSWPSWGACSKTCGIGLIQRHRQCNNPTPSPLGKQCDGDPAESKLCVLKPCDGGPVAFTVNYDTGIYSDNVLIFKTVVTNKGNGYNIATGKFTCTVPGTYSFSLTLIARGDYNVYCHIRKNTKITIGVTTYRTLSVSVYLDLSVGDMVDVGNCYGFSHLYDSIGTTFSGALV